MMRVFDDNCLIEDSDCPSDSSSDDEAMIKAQTAKVVSKSEFEGVRAQIEEDFDQDIDCEHTSKMRNKIIKKRKIAQKTTLKNRQDSNLEQVMKRFAEAGNQLVAKLGENIKVGEKVANISSWDNKTGWS